MNIYYIWLIGMIVSPVVRWSWRIGGCLWLKNIHEHECVPRGPLNNIHEHECVPHGPLNNIVVREYVPRGPLNIHNTLRHIQTAPEDPRRIHGGSFIVLIS